MEEVRKKPKTEKHWIRFWQDWKAVVDSYPELGKTEQEEMLGKMYGVSGRTIRSWKEAHPPETEIYTRAEEFLKIPFVKEWYDSMMELDPARETYLRSAFARARECWEFNDRVDPRLWNEDSIKKCIKAWRDQGIGEKSLKNYKTGLRKFLAEVKQPVLNSLYNSLKKTVLKVGASATKRGTEEVFHQPLTKKQFLVFREKMDEACRDYLDGWIIKKMGEPPVKQEPRYNLFPSLEWLQKLMKTENYLSVFTGLRTGDYKWGIDMLGIRVVIDPRNIPKVKTRAGEFEVAHVLLTEDRDRIIKWDILAKWYLRWSKIVLPPEVEKMVLEWINDADLKHGDALFPIREYHYRKIFQLASYKCRFHEWIPKEEAIPLFVRHNLRSTNLLWLCEADIPLEIAIEMGVGWDTIETARKFYLKIRKVRIEEQKPKLFQYAKEVMP